MFTMKLISHYGNIDVLKYVMIQTQYQLKNRGLETMITELVISVSKL